MNDVAPGAVGEIVYRGPTMMLEYWQNPAATADAFQGGMVPLRRSGSSGRRGFVYVVDRKKDMIISGGENIYCAEVENALFAHPKILEAAVIGRPRPQVGRDPVAVVALRPDAGGELTLEELQPFLDEQLARYKHPKAVVCVERCRATRVERSSRAICGAGRRPSSRAECGVRRRAAGARRQVEGRNGTGRAGA